jgi:hypothetical protein
MTALFLTIHNAGIKSWWQTILWVGYNALGSLLPIWGTYFLLKLHGQHFHLNDFVRHGEFALYSATFLAPALQMVVRNIREGKYVLGTGAVLFAFVGFATSVIIYSGVATGNKYPSDIDEFFLFWISLALFGTSLGFATIVALIENRSIPMSEEPRLRSKPHWPKNSPGNARKPRPGCVSCQHQAMIRRPLLRRNSPPNSNRTRRLPTAERLAAMADEGFVYFKRLEVRQPIGTFYVGTMSFNQVTLISYADIRRIDDLFPMIRWPDLPMFRFRRSPLSDKIQR